MSLEEQIIDVVLKCANNIRFKHWNAAMAFEQFYIDTKALYQCNPAQFDACSFSLLEVADFSSCSETYIIKMECVGIYHKNGLDVYLFRMRYFLNIASNKDDYMLEKKAISAFTFKNKDAIAFFDARSPYEKLFSDVLKAENDQNDRLRKVLHRFVAEKWPVDFDCLIPYVHIAQLAGIKIPKKYETLFLVLTEIPTILGDGLQIWIANNRDFQKKIANLAVAFKRMEMDEAQILFEALNERLSKNESLKLTDDFAAVENNIKQTLIEHEVYNAAQSYFKKQKNVN